MPVAVRRQAGPAAAARPRPRLTVVPGAAKPRQTTGLSRPERSSLSSPEAIAATAARSNALQMVQVSPADRIAISRRSPGKSTGEGRRNGRTLHQARKEDPQIAVVAPQRQLDIEKAAAQLRIRQHRLSGLGGAGTDQRHAQFVGEEAQHLEEDPLLAR